MTAEDIARYEAWATGPVPRRTKYRTFIMGSFYSIARAFEFRPTVSRLVFGAIRVISTLLVTAIPVGAKFAKDILAPSSTTIPWSIVAWASAGVCGLLLYNKTYDYIKRLKKEQKEITEQRSDIAQKSAKLTNVMAKSKLTGLTDIEIERVQTDILHCILYESRLSTGIVNGKFLETTLVLFDAECQNVCVANRAVGVRTVDARYPAAETMAYHIARSGRYRVINSFMRDHPFPKKGLSSPSPTYKSILFAPIIAKQSEKRYLCCGVVTVDSERPYEFWGGKGRQIVLHIQAHLNLLRMTLPDAPYLECLPPESN